MRPHRCIQYVPLAEAASTDRLYSTCTHTYLTTMYKAQPRLCKRLIHVTRRLVDRATWQSAACGCTTVRRGRLTQHNTTANPTNPKHDLSRPLSTTPHDARSVFPTCTYDSRPFGFPQDPPNHLFAPALHTPAKAHSARGLLGHHGRRLTVEFFAAIRTEVDEPLPHVRQTDKLGNLDD